MTEKCLILRELFSRPSAAEAAEDAASLVSSSSTMSGEETQVEEERMVTTTRTTTMVKRPNNDLDAIRQHRQVQYDYEQVGENHILNCCLGNLRGS